MDQQFKEPVKETTLNVSEEQRAAFELTLFNHFRLDKELGAGGMSVVYKCTDLAVDRPVAVKFLNKTLVNESKSLMRFQQEAKAIGRLSHPNIVRVHHFDVEGTEPYIVMDYIEGTALSDLLASKGSLSISRAVKLMLQVMDALSHAHSHSVVHRDLKPSNLMVINVDMPKETIKILDFGIAKVDGEEPHYKLTQTGEIFGSPLYMSPEQCQGKKSDERSDQYSCACVLFECLTGYPPFTGDNAVSILVKHLNEAPLSLKEASLGREFPAALEDVVRTMLDKDPEKRFRSIAEAKRSLEAAMSKQTDASQPLLIKVDRPLLNHIFIAFSSIVLLSLVAASFLYLLGPTNPLGPPVETKEIMSNVEDDYGDTALTRYLNSDHLYDQTLDTHNLEYKIMTDKGLERISRMPNLMELNLTNCGHVTVEGLKHLVKIPNLQRLNLAGLTIGDNCVPILLQMKSLQHLNLTNTHIHDDGIAKLAASKLERLTLSMNDATDQTCQAISKITTLQLLNLSHNRRLSSGTKYLASLPELYHLDLGDTGVNDADLLPLLKLKKLRDLCLGGTYITGAGVKTLAKISTLECLYLDSNKDLDRRIFSDLAKLKRLTYVNLHNTNVLPEDVAKFVAARRAAHHDCVVDLRPPGSPDQP